MSDHYRHTQFGWVILGSLAPVVAAAVPFLVAARALPLVLAVLGFTAVVLLLFGTMTVLVDTERIELRFGVGILRKRVPLARVRSFRRARNRWWYGWGIRAIPGGWMWNVSGLDAVELALEGGRLFRIGTDEPEALLAAIQRVHGPSRPMTPEEAEAERGGRRRLAAVFIALGAVVVAAVAAIFHFHMQPPKVTVTPEALTVRSAFYGARIPPSEMTSVTLEESLPRILARTNGFAAGGTLRGHFRLETLGDGQLFIERDRPPFVLVRSRDGYVIVGFEDPARTRALYDELRRLLSAGEERAPGPETAPRDAG